MGLCVCKTEALTNAHKKLIDVRGAYTNHLPPKRERESKGPTGQGNVANIMYLFETRSGVRI